MLMSRHRRETSISRHKVGIGVRPSFLNIPLVSSFMWMGWGWYQTWEMLSMLVLLGRKLSIGLYWNTLFLPSDSFCPWLLMKRSPWPSHLELSLKIATSINQWNRTHNYNTLPYMFVHNFHDSLCFIHTIVLILCLQKSSFVWCEIDIACPKLICHVWSYLSQTVARSSIFPFPYFPCARKSGMEAWITLSQVALFHHYTELCFPGVFV